MAMIDVTCPICGAMFDTEVDTTPGIDNQVECAKCGEEFSVEFESEDSA